MAKPKEIFLTAEGYLKVENELNYLKLEKRPQITDAIKQARAQGDLSENADYAAAREEQGAVESRIKELEYIMTHAKIVESIDNDDCVCLGKVVTISYVDDDETEEYRIVGSIEADPFNNKISNESPIGSAIMGKRVGDIISVESPTGSYDVKITRIA